MNPKADYGWCDILGYISINYKHRQDTRVSRVYSKKKKLLFILPGKAVPADVENIEED